MRQEDEASRPQDTGRAQEPEGSAEKAGGDFDITEKDECRDIELVADRAERKLSLPKFNFYAYFCIRINREIKWL